MIAQPYEPEFRPLPATSVRSRAARGAAQRRRARSHRLRYAMAARITVIVGVLTLCVVVYLGLMANIQRMNYDLGRVERERTSLVARSSQLEDTLARLRSRERLARLAAALGMHEPQRFASIAMPIEHHEPPPTGLAFLAKLR